MNESTFRVHEVEFVAKATPGLGDGGRVGEHGDRTVDRSKFAVRNKHRLLVVNAKFKTGWTPLDQVKRGLGLDISNSPGAVVRHHVTLVKKSHCHILSGLRIADDHLVPRFKACKMVSLKGHFGRKDRRTYTLQGEIFNLEALVSTAATRDERSIRD
jgi:hypothetical protein